MAALWQLHPAQSNRLNQSPLLIHIPGEARRRAMTNHKWTPGLQATAESWPAVAVLDWALKRFGKRIAIASAFGPEGMVLIDLASRLRSNFQVFTLDTGLFFRETYDLMHEVEQRYGIQIERVQPALTVQQQGAAHGPALWETLPDRCCQMRKIEPLRRKLATLDAWVSAIRRDQTTDRAHAHKVEWDARFGLVKINPICDWTNGMVWDYVVSNNVPYNPLHDRGYPSIGCAPCTKPVQIGGDPRSGRWAGFAKTECGLHECAAR
jgi:phosphoadenosine phosphosulfate reductase